ncbi:unnamed protein product, partial [Hapterophycus canaliculatus]
AYPPARCPLQALGILCYIGISFGPVFTASIGGTRREFMLVGDVVNTAGAIDRYS